MKLSELLSETTHPEESGLSIDAIIYNRRVNYAQNLQEISVELGMRRHEVQHRIDVMRRGGISIPDESGIINNLIFRKIIDENKPMDQVSHELGISRKSIARRIRQDRCLRTAIAMKQQGITFDTPE